MRALKYIDPFNQDKGVQEISEEDFYSLVTKGVKHKLNIPDSWDKFDYDTKRYSLNDIIDFSYNLMLDNIRATAEIGLMINQNSELNWGKFMTKLIDLPQFKLDERARLPLYKFINYHKESIELSNILINEIVVTDDPDKTDAEKLQMIDYLTNFTKQLHKLIDYAVEQYYKYLSGEFHDNILISKILSFDTSFSTLNFHKN